MAAMNERRQEAREDSPVMLATLGILAYAASMMTHEAVGHGGACVALGGHNVMLTVWQERCSFVGGHGSWLKAAGPGVQFCAGWLALLGLRALPSRAARLGYFLWMYAVLSLLVSSGYLAFSGVTNFGDAAELIAGLRPGMVWRAGLVVAGSVVYYLSMIAAAFELKRFAGLDTGGGRVFRLVWIPYAAVGVFACCTGALNHTMEHGLAPGLAAASSFGAGMGMLWLPQMQRGMGFTADAPAVCIRWSGAWGAIAAVVILGFVFFLGPGLE